MSLRANIDHLAAAHGIVAVAVRAPHSDRDFRGDDAWRSVLDGSLGLLGISNQPSIRLVVGTNTVVVQGEGDEMVAVVLPTGHPIAKSLRRMIRRMARKDRAPLRETTLPAAATLGRSNSTAADHPTTFMR